MRLALALASVGVCHGASLSTIQELYEDFVAQATENRSTPLMEISEHLLVFTVWNIMSTTAVSTLKRGFSSCKEGVESSVCNIFPDSLLLAAPLLMAEGGGQVAVATASEVGVVLAELGRRALDLIVLVRQALIVHGNSVVGASVAYAMDLVYVALWKPEFGMSWYAGGGAPRLLLPHCSPADFVNALPWEGVVRPSNPMHWLSPLLDKLPAKSFLNVALRERDANESCDLETFGTFLDPSCGLESLDAWDTLVIYRDVTQCVGQASCLSHGHLRPHRQALQGARELSKDGVESLLQDRSVDVLTLSPLAGNCAELRRLLDGTMATARPQVVVLTINALLAPPRRAVPDFYRARRLEGSLMRRCSLQAAVDFLAPKYSLLFVDTLRAVFVCASLVRLFGEAAAPAQLWRRGVSCTLPVTELLEGEKLLPKAAALGNASWPCDALQVPQLAARLPVGKDVYPESEARCVAGGLETPIGGATSPMTPGRGQLISGRGRCFLEERFCECFPPWRDALCDREEKGESEDRAVIVTRVLPGDEEEMERNLWNWWESFNNQIDHPILVFHEGLRDDQTMRLKAASPSRVWFAHLGPLLRKPHKLHPRELAEEALSCRFKFAWLFEEPSIQDFDWVMWIDADVAFPIPFDRDLVRETSTAGAALGFIPATSRPPKALRTLALLFRQAERRQREAESLDMHGVGLSSSVMVFEMKSFRTGLLQRFAAWTLEFSYEVSVCRWGEQALRNIQVSFLPPEKRLSFGSLRPEDVT